MLIRLGTDASDARIAGEIPFEFAMNPHMLVVGGSGSGKTTLLRSNIEQAVRSSGGRCRFHVLDSHGDIVVPGESVVRFSQSARVGFNPLEVNPHPEFGGVRRAVDKFVAGIEEMSQALGPRQLATLRSMLMELYASRGYDADDPRTWQPEPPEVLAAKLAGKEGRVWLDVPFAQKDKYKAELRAAGATGSFDRDLGLWWCAEADYKDNLLVWAPRAPGRTSPTLGEAVRYAEHLMKAVFLGANSQAAKLADAHARAAAAYHRKVTTAQKEGDAEKLAKLKEGVTEAKTKAVESFKRYLDSVESGRELDEVLRCRSFDVMQAVWERLKIMLDMGFFHATPPPLDPRSPVWRYDISPLSKDQRRLFVRYLMSLGYDRAMERGRCDHIVEIYIVDEAAQFLEGAQDDHPIDVYAREIRKFGVGLWAAAQAVTNFSPDFLRNTASKIVLKTDELDFAGLEAKLAIDRRALAGIVPFKTALMQCKRKDQPAGGYRTVALGS